VRASERVCVHVSRCVRASERGWILDTDTVCYHCSDCNYYLGAVCWPETGARTRIRTHHAQPPTHPHTHPRGTPICTSQYRGAGAHGRHACSPCMLAHLNMVRSLRTEEDTGQVHRDGVVHPGTLGFRLTPPTRHPRRRKIWAVVMVVQGGGGGSGGHSWWMRMSAWISRC
jgi:hypothetical protein